MMTSGIEGDFVPLLFRLSYIRKEVRSMDKPTIFFAILWCVLLVITAVLMTVGIKPEDLIGEFLGLMSPLIYLLVRKRRK